MKLSQWFAVVSVVSCAATLAFGCAQSGFGDNTTDSGSNQDGTTGATCQSCVIDKDCNGGVCTQLGGDSYCAAHCTDTSQCPSGEQCLSATSISGDQVSVCVDVASTQCGPNHVQPGNDAGPPPPSCPGYADPNTSAPCTSCTAGSNGCQTNGCFGGWWCNLNSKKCNPQPSGCSVGDGGTPHLFDGGFTSNITKSGGTENHLYFAVIGDTRPANDNDTTNYPTTIINTIFQDIAKVSPMPPFVVTTGDYMFAYSSGNEGANQLNLYLKAKGYYSGYQFPAMGNHECTGSTNSNCGSGNQDGVTNNYSSFLSMMLGPIGQTKPYYVINVNASDNSWTSKFVFVAANAWDSTQASWLSTQLAVKTTYTFIVRHEGANATTAPGVSPAETIMAGYPYTLSIVGHSHDYYHGWTSKEVTIGNGGAPISGSQNYGYALVQQLTNGNVQVDMYDYSTNVADSKFSFNVAP